MTKRQSISGHLYLFSGFNSGVMGCMILLGNVSGAAVGTCFTVSFDK